MNILVDAHIHQIKVKLYFSFIYRQASIETNLMSTVPSKKKPYYVLSTIIYSQIL